MEARNQVESVGIGLAGAKLRASEQFWLVQFSQDKD